MKNSCLAIIFFFTMVSGALASPARPLTWEKSEFSVPNDAGPVQFHLECPEGKVARLSATQRQHTAVFPVNRLSELGVTGVCSGAYTLKEEDGISLVINLSQEYTREELWIFLNLKTMKFTAAQRWLTESGSNTVIKKLESLAK